MMSARRPPSTKTNTLMGPSMKQALVLTATLVAITAGGSPAVAQQPNEILASTTVIGDVEFDWARDGVYDASANFGQGNARFNWTDRLYNLWVGHIDPTTGAFTPEQ